MSDAGGRIEGKFIQIRSSVTEWVFKVKKLLSLRNSLDSESQNTLINEIDDIVYQLYNLTEEEIAIIEEATA